MGLAVAHDTPVACTCAISTLILVLELHNSCIDKSIMLSQDLVIKVRKEEE